MSSPVREVGVLQHGVHGSADRRAVAAPLPRREVEVDGVLGQPGVVRRPARRPPSVGRRGGEQRRRAGWRSSPSAPTPRPSARARSASHVAGVGPRQLERLGRRRGASGVGRAVERPRARGRRAPASASTVALVALAVPSVDVLRLAVQRHDEVVDGPGAGDVQQAPALGVAHLLVERLERLEQRRLSAARRSAQRARPGQTTDIARAPLHLGGQPADDRDRELQALGGVHRHDPHGVVVALGQDRVAGPALGRLVGGPPQVAAHAASAGVGPRPGLVDDVAHPPPDVAGVGPGERGLEHAPLVDDAVEQLGRRRRGRRRVAIERDVGDRRADRMVGRAPPAASANGFQRPPAALPVVQLDVAAAVQRRAQGGDERQLVGRVGGGAQRQQQVADLRRDVDDRRVLGAVRDGEARRAPPRASAATCGPGAARRCRRRRHGRSPPSPSPTGQPSRERGGHGGGDDGRLALAQHLRRRRRRRSWSARAEHVTVPWSRRPGPAGVERDVRRLHVGLGLDDLGEHAVDPVDDGRRSSGSWPTAPRARRRPGRRRPRYIGDVGAPEAVDRLLRVADDEQPAGERPQRR